MIARVWCSLSAVETSSASGFSGGPCWRPFSHELVELEKVDRLASGESDGQVVGPRPTSTSAVTEVLGRGCAGGGMGKGDRAGLG